MIAAAQIERKVCECLILQSYARLYPIDLSSWAEKLMERGGTCYCGGGRGMAAGKNNISTADRTSGHTNPFDG